MRIHKYITHACIGVHNIYTWCKYDNDSNYIKCSTHTLLKGNENISSKVSMVSWITLYFNYSCIIESYDIRELSLQFIRIFSFNLTRKNRSSFRMCVFYAENPISNFKFVSYQIWITKCLILPCQNVTDN